MATKKIKIVRVMNDKNGWAVCIGQDEREICGTYVGAIISPYEDMELMVTGENVVHPVYGEQFKVTSASPCLNQSVKSIENYLLKSGIKGLGPGTVSKIIKRFKENSLDVIQNHWEQLAEIKGISLKKAESIHNAESTHAPLLELLRMEGITLLKAQMILDAYGEQAAAVVKSDPYRMIYEIDGIGFSTADKIALSNGMDPQSEKRIAAAIVFRLRNVGEEGHCYDNRDTLLQHLHNKLIPEVDTDLITKVLESQIKSRMVVDDENALYSKEMYACETGVSEYVRELMTWELYKAPKAKVEKVIKRIEDESAAKKGVSFEYEPLQRKAVYTVLQNPISVITGGAGTGKTTIVETVVKAYRALHRDPDVFLCAPTGKAAKRLKEAVGGQFRSSTVHRLVRNEVPACGSLLVCDEASMLDLEVASMFLRYAVEHQCRVAFVGDVHQLPPVGAGMFFRDLLHCDEVPKVELSMCHRQTGNIARNANAVNGGAPSSKLIFDGVTTSFIDADKDHAVDVIWDAYTGLVEKYGLDNVCVIAPFRKSGRSPTSTSDLNALIRARVNPNQPQEGCKFAVGDRVMCQHNDTSSDIFNGEVGTVERIDKYDGYMLLRVDGRIKRIPIERQEQYDLAYAMSVHKSQGSEYAAVIFACNIDHYVMLERNLIYTAITRAKKEMVIVGEREALDLGIRTTKAIKRRSKLLDRLNGFAC